MSIQELIKILNDIKAGEAEFPLPDTMIDEIIERLEKIEIKKSMTIARTSYWADILSSCSGDCRGVIEAIVKEAGGEVIKG